MTGLARLMGLAALLVCVPVGLVAARQDQPAPAPAPAPAPVAPGQPAPVQPVPGPSPNQPAPNQPAPNQPAPNQATPNQPTADSAAKAKGVPRPPPPDPDQESDPGKRAMLLAAKAVHDLRTLSYRSKVYATGSLEQMLPHGEGLVFMVRAENERFWLQHATGTGAAKASDPETPFDIAWQETSIEWVDHAAKKVMSRPTRQAKGPAYQLGASIRLQEILDVNPLSKELAAEGFTMEGPEDVGGVMCDVVTVTHAGAKSKSKWWLGQADHLPHKVSRIFDGPNGTGELVLELSEVTVGAPVSPELLHVPTPAGYTRDEVAASTGLPPPNLARPAKGDPTPVNGAAATQPDTPPAPPPPPAKPPAPPFELSAGTGEKVSLQSLAGHVVVLQFWGTWHLPSRAACAELQTLADKFKDQKVKVYAPAVREKTADAAKDFVQSGGYTFGVLLDADKMAETYGVVRFPTYIVIGPHGELLETIAGYKKDETIKKVGELVEAALKEPAGP